MRVLTFRAKLFVSAIALSMAGLSTWGLLMAVHLLGLLRISGPLDGKFGGGIVTMYVLPEDAVDDDADSGWPLAPGDEITFGCPSITNTDGLDLRIDGAELIGDGVAYELVEGPVVGPPSPLVCSALGPLELNLNDPQDFGPDGYKVEPGRTAYIGFTLRYVGPGEGRTEGVQIDYSVGRRKYTDFTSMRLHLCRDIECSTLPDYDS